MLKLLGQTEFGKEIGWQIQQVHGYYREGRLPKPYAMIGKRPAWTQEQVERYKKERR